MNKLWRRYDQFVNKSRTIPEQVRSQFLSCHQPQSLYVLQSWYQLPCRYWPKSVYWLKFLGTWLWIRDRLFKTCFYTCMLFTLKCPDKLKYKSLKQLTTNMQAKMCWITVFLNFNLVHILFLYPIVWFDSKHYVVSHKLPNI